MKKMKKLIEDDRRGKFRFPMHRELKYKVLKDGTTLEAGCGQTIDMGSGGILFEGERSLEEGAFIQLSVSWPVLLDNGCPMRLVIYGRVLRCERSLSACTIDKYEFRTQARAAQPQTISPPNDFRLERWVDAVRKDQVKPRLAMA
jgi:hypothetical protein